jgi:hypothetical protein
MNSNAELRQLNNRHGFVYETGTSIFKHNLYDVTASVVRWSEFLATDPEPRVRFLALPEKKQWVWNGVHSAS